jgi:hypothetical protein
MERGNHKDLEEFLKKTCSLIEDYYPSKITIVELYGAFETLKGFISSQNDNFNLN